MPSVAWYLQRLGAMPPAEMPWRAWRIVRRRWGRCRRWPTAEELRLGDVFGGDCSAEVFRSQKVDFPPAPDETAVAHWPADWRDTTLAEAEDLLAHRVSFFALKRQPLGDRIDWNRDYSSGKQVPLGYAARLDYRNPAVVGDVKYVWELGRMQHLTRLAQAWCLTHDDRFAAEVVEQITDWIGQCPWMMGVDWVSPMEAGLRLISWTWAFHLIRRWSGLTDRFCRLFVRSVAQHLRFIDGNYSRFSSANNHLIAEASGAYLAAAYWSELKPAARWKARAKRHLVRECERQNYADGVNREQTFAYQFFVWDLLLIPALMGRTGGDEFPQPYFDRLERMAEFLAWVSDCRGNTAHVGDEDDGRAVILSSGTPPPVLSLLNTAAGVWQRDDFRHWAGNLPDEKTAWLLGHADIPEHDRKASTIRPTPHRGNRSFSSGGYHVLRHGTDTGEEVLVVFDVGPLGWPATAAHGHADALSVLLHLGGQPVFIDPGTFSYQDTPWRHYFRATAQHNTLSFGPEDQGEYVNRFQWGRRPKVELLRAEIGEGCELLEGRVVWWNGAKHGRQLKISAPTGRLEIRDVWDGPQPPTICFCLAPSVRAEQSGRVCLVETETARLTLQNDSAPMELEPAEVSLRCYRRQSTHRVCIHPPTSAGETVSVVSWEFK